VPWAYWKRTVGVRNDNGQPTTPNQYAERIQETLSIVMGPGKVLNTYGLNDGQPRRPTVAGVFRDGDTQEGGVWHYMANARIFGYYSDSSNRPLADPYWGASGTGAFWPVKISNMKPSTEIAQWWCANQTGFEAVPHPIFQGSSNWTSINMDNNGARSAAFGYFIRGVNPANEQTVIHPEFFKQDLGGPINGTNQPRLTVRTRHLKNTTANLLFMDGHVASFRGPDYPGGPSDLIRKLFCVPPPKPNPWRPGDY